MTNILDYLDWRGDISFSFSKFSEVDALVLARFTYAPIDKINIDLNKKNTIADICAKFLSLDNLKNIVLIEEDILLFEKLKESSRFKDLELLDYRNIVDKDSEQQFCAMTIKIDDNIIHVGFRGTDSTLIGWKEDFNMTFTFPVSSQKSSITYLDEMGKKYNQKILISGHSKGGNLAMCSAMYADKKINEKIIQIFNFDGPGFPDEIINSKEYEGISDRLLNFIPESSIFGMMLGHEEHIVIDSKAKNIIYQHDLYTWIIKRNHFVYFNDITNSSKVIDYTLKNWVKELTNEQREKFADIIYEIFSSSDKDTIKELKTNYFETIKSLVNATLNLNDEEKALMMKSFGVLIKNMKEGLLNNYIKK